MKSETQNPIVAKIQERAEIAEQRRELKKRAKQARIEQDEINKAFIREQLEKFVKAVKRNPDPYIYGDTHPFTKFVNRYGMSINSEHRDAYHKFMQAKEDLAKAFVKGVIENKNDEHETIIRYAGIKNIKDMEHYFR